MLVFGREMKNYSILLLVVIFITACGSEENNSNTPTWPPSNENVEPDRFGYFLDSAVDGVRYISGEHYGTTDSNGRFGYIVGENIEFYIGDILIGDVISPSDRLTPFELSNRNASSALNILRFLQTLDDDSDPNNGIQITETIHYLASSKALDFSDPGWSSELGFGFTRTEIEALMLELTSGTEAGSRFPESKLGAYYHFEFTLDNLIDDRANDLINLSAQSTCDSDNQCSAVELLTKSTRYCPPYGPLVAYSTTNINQTTFNSIVADREYLINIKGQIERAAEANEMVTGVCIRTPLSYQTICNNLSQCEIQN